jgi:protein required for attachment to host cells
MNKETTYLRISPLYPLKGKIAVNNHLTKLIVIAPLRGLGVMRNSTTNKLNAHP